jgi:hypothetical protein
MFSETTVMALARLETVLLDDVTGRHRPAPAERDEPVRKPTPTGVVGEHSAAGDH